MEEQVKNFLDEGFDFIEESCSAEPLQYVEADNNVILESRGEKSPYHVLGVCRGVFQPINEPSRNRRIYESTHWETQLKKPEVQERLKTRSMWGTLGHFDRKVTDADVREGLISHIITKLDIREDANGKPYLYGELEILDTPAGRILEGMYKGGANLFVSSRGAGKLLTVAGDPLKHVDPNSYYFEGFDIVRAAGYPKARPVYESAVSEDKKESVHESENTTESVALASETSSISSQPSSTSEELTTLKSQIDKLAKIVEKVVDDVYEEAEPAAQATAESTSEAQEDDYEWSVVRKNALANPNLYGGRYTDKDAKKAKKQYLEDKKNNFKTTSEAQEEPKQKVLEPKPAESKQMQEQPIAPVQKEKANEALADFVSLMASTNISEEKFGEILDIMADSLKKESK